jgi:thiol-disulfide isomerase/thioredoxin
LVCALAAAVLALAALPLDAQSGVLRLRGLQGETLTDADLARGTTIVVVWASWSPRCRNLAQRMPAVQAAAAGKGRVVTVNFEEQPDAARAFLANGDLGAPVYLDSDGAFARRYAISTLPGLLVLKDGEVAFRGKLPESPAGVIADALK